MFGVNLPTSIILLQPILTGISEVCLLGVKFITTINYHRDFPLGFNLASAEKLYGRIATQGWDLAERHATAARIKEAQNRNLPRKDIKS